MRLEIITTLHDGYSEVMILPDTIQSKPYEINMSITNILIISVDDYSTSVLIPNVTGKFMHGQNIINKNGGITISQP